MVKMVKMMKCHAWWDVKLKETVSDEAREDQWRVRSIEQEDEPEEHEERGGAEGWVGLEEE